MVMVSYGVQPLFVLGHSPSILFLWLSLNAWILYQESESWKKTGVSEELEIIRLKCHGFTCGCISLKSWTLPVGLEGQTLTCLSSRMPAMQQRESLDFCQHWVLVLEFSRCPWQRTPCCCSVCFSRSFSVWGKKMWLPVDSFQVSADGHEMLSSWNVLFSVCQSLPAFPHGVWVMTEEYALSIWNEVSPVEKSLCYSAVTFPLELFTFILRPSISFSPCQA